MPVSPPVAQLSTLRTMLAREATHLTLVDSVPVARSLLPASCGPSLSQPAADSGLTSAYLAKAGDARVAAVCERGAGGSTFLSGMGERRIAELVQRPRAAWHARPRPLPGPRSPGASRTRALRAATNSGA